VGGERISGRCVERQLKACNGLMMMMMMVVVVVMMILLGSEWCCLML
jgi:hypothetical protein